jgi:2-keto-4-pentenoate hydratase/2-oxohepta-3-ene-1,7-dioic acid hydratase in catechol pathway
MRIGNLSGRLSVFTDAGAVDVERASQGRFGVDPESIYPRWAEFVDWAKTCPDTSAVEFSRHDLGAPSPRPAQIFALGANYRDHIAEGGIETPEYPMVFTKFVSSFTGPVGTITLTSSTVDWEAELVVIIGKQGHNVAPDDAWDYVAGLTVGQDLSDRVVQLRGQIPQLSLGKSFPEFSPTGPWLVTPDEFANPDDLEITCVLNGDTKQKARTGDMIYSVPAFIAELSAIVVLYPGDVLFTGTPSGVGFVEKPPRYLGAGDELVTTIEGIGEMRHHFQTA